MTHFKECKCISTLKPEKSKMKCFNDSRQRHKWCPKKISSTLRTQWGRHFQQSLRTFRCWAQKRLERLPAQHSPLPCNSTGRTLYTISDAASQWEFIPSFGCSLKCAKLRNNRLQEKLGGIVIGWTITS